MTQSAPAPTYLPGVDASSVQGPLSLATCQTLRQRGTRFLITKAGNGNAGIDPDCAGNLANGRAAGLVVGLYDFPFGGLPNDPAHPNRDPVDQARLHHNQSAGLVLPGDLLPFADAEWPRPEAWGKPLVGVGGSPVVTGPGLRTWYRAYLDERCRLLGRMPGIYFDEQFMRALAPDPSFATSVPWIASWAPYVRPISPWAGWSIWQTSGGGGHLPDGAPIDTDVIADEATLASLLIT
jgi:GH25 family lysozyme M1 (1,4-beta-N-acetylmuramidase)